MAGIDEATLSSWTGRASDAEETRYDNTRKAVADAIDARNDTFKDASLDIYAKGSYPNFTNVVRDSDVDVAVEMTSVMYLDFEHEAKGMTKDDFDISDYTGSYDDNRLKDDVEAALVAAFGHAAVTRGDKALHVRQTSSRLAADVVPCYTKRTYYTRLGASHQGITIRPDKGYLWIDNFPAQQLQAGKNKNGDTYRRYKSCVRILKRLENKMVAEKVIKVVPSFLIESLVWNTPNSVFNNNDTWTERIKGMLVHVWEELETDASADSWLEANGVQLLFGLHQKWTRDEARQFAYDAWNHLGYGS